MNENFRQKSVKNKERYRFATLILFFFTFALMGWLWEVLYNYYQNGFYANRGFLAGPWLPIYGTGGVLILILSKKFFYHPIFTFFSTMIVCSILEYITSLFLEYRYHIRWWDYSQYKIHLNGRISLISAVFFGVGGCIIIYFLAPLLAKLYGKIAYSVQVAICIILLGLFVVDVIHAQTYPNTGNGITSSYMR